MKIYKMKGVSKFARREKITDASLLEAVARAERGLIDADLGGGLIKQRVARKGQGRSGGFRLLLAYRVQELVVFLYGFAKNELDNITPDQLAELTEVAKSWLSASPAVIEANIEKGTLAEIKHDEEKHDKA